MRNPAEADTYARKAEDSRRRFEDAWARLKFRYDSDDDGVADEERDAGLPLFAM